MEHEFFKADGKFQNYFTKLKKTLQPDQWKKFSSLSNIKDKIRFCLDIPGIDDIKITAAKSIKNLEKALEYKAKGNEYFKANQYQDAFQSYTLALQHCPVNEDNPKDP